MFIRLCPICQNSIHYKNARSLHKAEKANTMCKKCVGMSNGQRIIGSILSDDHKKNIGLGGLEKKDQILPKCIILFLN